MIIGVVSKCKTIWVHPDQSSSTRAATINRKGMVVALCMKEIANDVLFPDTTTANGIILGSNSTVCCLHNCGSIAVLLPYPAIMAGMKCYLPTFITILKLALSWPLIVLLHHYSLIFEVFLPDALA
jgi:hypothetical protein